MIKRLIKLAISLLVRGWDVFGMALLRCVGRGSAPTCVVLYYHGIDATRRERFARQMDQVLRFSQPVPADALGPLNGKVHYCAVTFDDGFVSVVENALPELERRRIPATLFVPTGSLGEKPGWMKNSAERVLPAGTLKALNENRLVTIGSHSVTHPDFTRLEQTEADRELRESRARLEAIIGHPVTLFSFPHGAYSPRSLELAQAAGYKRAFSIRPESVRAGGNGFVAGRVLADPDDWPLEFRLKLLGAYRWLAGRKNEQQKTESGKLK